MTLKLVAAKRRLLLPGASGSNKRYFTAYFFLKRTAYFSKRTAYFLKRTAYFSKRTAYFSKRTAYFSKGTLLLSFSASLAPVPACRRIINNRKRRRGAKRHTALKGARR